MIGNEYVLGETHVRMIGTETPVGVLLSEVQLDPGSLKSFVVRWGISDKREYKDVIPEHQLEIVEGIKSPEEVQLRQDLAKGGKIK